MIPAFRTPPRCAARLLHHSSYKWSDRPNPECLPRLITAQMAIPGPKVGEITSRTRIVNIPGSGIKFPMFHVEHWAQWAVSLAARTIVPWGGSPPSGEVVLP